MKCVWPSLLTLTVLYSLFFSRNLYYFGFLLLLIRFLLTTFPYKYAVQTASSTTRNIPYTFDNKSVSPQALDTISIKIQELGRSHRPCDIILCELGSTYNSSSNVLCNFWQSLTLYWLYPGVLTIVDPILAQYTLVLCSCTMYNLHTIKIKT